MTLEQFFARLMHKVKLATFIGTLEYDFYPKTPNEKILAELESLIFSARVTRPPVCGYDLHGRQNSWRRVVQLTKDSRLFDEFKGNTELREQLKKFLRGEI